jgi:hypothetical protein
VLNDSAKRRRWAWPLRLTRVVKGERVAGGVGWGLLMAWWSVSEEGELRPLLLATSGGARCIIVYVRFGAAMMSEPRLEGMERARHKGNKHGPRAV